MIRSIILFRSFRLIGILFLLIDFCVIPIVLFDPNSEEIDLAYDKWNGEIFSSRWIGVDSSRIVVYTEVV